jgi:4-hydroxybenzoate polyprenyltransferase
MPAVVRLVHPFPSLLDGAVVALVALVAGGGAVTAAALALSMTFLQFSIGTVNDLVDAPADAGHRPSKPIPAGEIRRSVAAVIATTSAAIGLTLAVVVGGGWLLLLAVTGLAIGLVYDLAAKGTTLSWLPLAVGIPILPVFGWYGATGELPGLFLVLVPAAANAGTALAIANAIVDAERDVKAGRASIATALGLDRAAALVIVLHGVVALLTTGSAAAVGAPAGWVVVVLLASVVPLGGAVLGRIAAGRPGSALRELAWEIQAVGAGLLAVAWLSALSASIAPVAA